MATRRALLASAALAPVLGGFGAAAAHDATLGQDATAHAEGAASETDAERADLIRATERERLRAFVAADLDALERLHAADFQLINPGGGVLTKEEYLGGIASGEIDYLVWDPASAIGVRLYGEAAAIRYQAHTEIVVGGDTIVVETWHTDVYERRDGQWQAVWSQATAIS